MAAVKIPGVLEDGTKWSWALGAGYQTLERTPRHGGTIVSDIEREWLWQARPISGDDVEQMKFSTRFDLELPRLDALPQWVGPMNFSLSGSHLGVTTYSEYPVPSLPKPTLGDRAFGVSPLVFPWFIMRAIQILASPLCTAASSHKSGLILVICGWIPSLRLTRPEGPLRRAGFSVTSAMPRVWP